MMRDHSVERRPSAAADRRSLTLAKDFGFVQAQWSAANSAKPQRPASPTKIVNFATSVSAGQTVAPPLLLRKDPETHVGSDATIDRSGHAAELTEPVKVLLSMMNEYKMEQQEELAQFKAHISNRVSTIEGNVDLITSILKGLEGRMSEMQAKVNMTQDERVGLVQNVEQLQHDVKTVEEVLAVQLKQVQRVLDLPVGTEQPQPLHEPPPMPSVVFANARPATESRMDPQRPANFHSNIRAHSPTGTVSSYDQLNAYFLSRLASSKMQGHSNHARSQQRPLTMTGPDSGFKQGSSLEHMGLDARLRGNVQGCAPDNHDPHVRYPSAG